MQLSRGGVSLPRWYMTVIGHFRSISSVDLALRDAALDCVLSSRSADVTHAWRLDSEDGSPCGHDHLSELRVRALAAVASADCPGGWRWRMLPDQVELVPHVVWEEV